MLKKIKNMKYKFKTNYVYVYFTDDKGSQGRLTYTKGDVVQGIVSADKINIKITPVKVYDIVAKKYITLGSIDVRSNFLEEIKTTSGQDIDESSHTIKKYRFLKDYIYQYSSTSDGKQHTKQYKKGDIIYGQEIYNGIVTGFDGNPVPSKYLTVGAVGYQWVYFPLDVLGNVLEVVPEYQQGRPDKSDIKNEPQPESKQSKIFTTNNILIGLAAIAIIGMGYYIIKK